MAVAKNRSTSRCGLLEMARYNDVDLRFSLAKNTTGPIALRSLFSEDNNPYSSCRA
ncbi:MAG: hypothetical protein Q8T09_18070 [Candidatus Melainabacteria bacterium]|nr:hypothetical protein [Candidatus Melainabacteria bacterium]